MIPKILEIVAHHLSKRDWKSEDAFTVALLTFVLCVMVLAAVVANVGFLILDVPFTAFTSVWMILYLGFPFYMGISFTLIKVYKYLGRV